MRDTAASVGMLMVFMRKKRDIETTQDVGGNADGEEGTYCT